MKILKFIYMLIAILAALVLGLYALSSKAFEFEKAAPAATPALTVQFDAQAQQLPSEAEAAVYPEEKAAPEGALTARDILAGNQLVSHGCGMLENVSTINCLEAIYQRYKEGIRAFEVDIRLTSDCYPVLRHDWRATMQHDVNELSIPTLEEFRSKKIFGEYTPLSFKDLLIVMEELPDICIITDTKFAEEEIVTIELEHMVQAAKELGLSYLFDRVVIQVYTQMMYKVAENVYPFPNYIYTLYYEGFSCTEDEFEIKTDFCEKAGMLGITMPDIWWDKSYARIAGRKNLGIWVHTINDTEFARRVLNEGAVGVYTDSITPAEL